MKNKTYSNRGGWEEKHRDSCNRFHSRTVTDHHIAVLLSDHVEGLTSGEHQDSILRSI